MFIGSRGLAALPGWMRGWRPCRVTHGLTGRDDRRDCGGESALRGHQTVPFVATESGRPELGSGPYFVQTRLGGQRGPMGAAATAGSPGDSPPRRFPGGKVRLVQGDTRPSGGHRPADRFGAGSIQG